MVKSLDFPVKKTKKSFLRNYSISDKAAEKGDRSISSRLSFEMYCSR